MNDGKDNSTLASFRQKLAGRKGRRLWRSLQEIAGSPDFRRAVMDEFPPGASDSPESFSRRGFLKVLGASLALAGVAGCDRKTPEAIVPYVSQPESVTPGKPLYYATAMTLGGYGQGIVAESHEGRPTKLEGNPEHSAVLGASDVYMQAELLQMYDPDRSNVVQYGDLVKDWDSFVMAVRPWLEARRGHGSSIRLLTETITSPSLIKQIQDFKAAYPGAKWHRYDPINRDNIRLGLAAATGKQQTARYDFSKANTIVALDCDFLQEEPGHLVYSRQFADGRRIRVGTTSMNRLYVFESTPTVTGSMADHRWAMKPSAIAPVAAALARALGVDTAGVAPAPNLDKWAAAIAKDLQTGPSIVVAGAAQPPAVHALVHAINQKLGNVGRSVIYAPPVEADADGTIQDLVRDMDAGAVDTLLILGGNPVYTAPAELNFADKLMAFLKAHTAGQFTNLSVHLGLYEDETSFVCQWHLPQTHFLEQWGDARAFDGSVVLMQPLISPLYSGKSMHEVLDILTSNMFRRGYDIVRGYWAGAKLGGEDFDSFWQKSVERGVMPTSPDFNPNPPPATLAAPPPPAAGSGTYELVFRPDPSIYDGCYSNNGWLQEIPKPLSKLTWDNAAILSPATAQKLGVDVPVDLTTGPGSVMVTVEIGGRKLDLAAFVLPGQTDDVITIHLGYGRTRAGQVGTAQGFNAYLLRTSDAPWFVTGASVTRSNGQYQLVTTHTHQSMADRRVGVGDVHMDSHVVDHPEPAHEDESQKEAEIEIDNRKLIRVATLEQYRQDPKFAQKMNDTPKVSLSMFPTYDPVYDKNLKWGMSIDLQTCIGCNACVVACQAENNIPIVGKDQVARGREMHWIRVDTYFEGEAASPTAMHNQPVPCMQCENAPCELVCPVGATIHDNEGLNDMTYNRCVGTRYCSNNCPYKVRRFNFYSYSEETSFGHKNSESLKLMRNPEVTVRSRGIMEKCTYCIQRITATRVEMEKLQVESDSQAAATKDPNEQQKIQQLSAQRRQLLLDGLQTACQQACPTHAIVFGNINPAVQPLAGQGPSQAKQLKDLPTDYGLLDNLTTVPRTTYLARVQNPNEQLGEGIGVSTDDYTNVIAAKPPVSAGTHVLAAGHTYGSVTDKISAIVLTQKPGFGWVFGTAIAAFLVMVLTAAVSWLLLRGVGIWGINIPVAWGFAIVNFVWWIGIGHAGTFISAMLLLMKQEWRTSINRFAEAMTLFAVACAGMFPLLHMGRPWQFYWLMPYPNTMLLWPQFRSPLVWDVFAVSTYGTVSLLFWYVGLVPDLGTLRDRARNRVGQIIYGIFSLGWRGSARHWQHYSTAYLILGGLAAPLVVSVHSVVGMDFAASQVPGWHSTIFPPYFVAGAIFSGFAVVLCLAIPLRKFYGLQDFITLRHLDNCAKLMLVTGLIVAYGYSTELFYGWYSGNEYEMFLNLNRISGPYWPAYAMLLFCNVLTPQLLWFKAVRRNVPLLFVIAMIVNVGMWLERFVIIITSLARDFLPSSWHQYYPTIWDWATYFGTIGFFLLAFFLFIRFLPVISIFEMRELVEDQAVGETKAASGPEGPMAIEPA